MRVVEKSGPIIGEVEGDIQRLAGVVLPVKRIHLIIIVQPIFSIITKEISEMCGMHCQVLTVQE